MVVTFSEERLRRLLDQFRGKKIAVVGDLMIDRYYWGEVRRVSPEAPVPVVEVESESVRFGGAANVANNIQALGGVPFLVGLIGDDHPGSIFKKMLHDQGLDDGGIVVDPARATTIKTRVIAAGQHVVRIDYESKQDCPSSLRERLIGALRSHMGSIDGVIIEDYNKGVVTRELIGAVVAAARAEGKPVTVDPKFNNFFEYRDVTVFKPNRREVEEVVGGKLRTNEDVERAGRKVLQMLGAQNVLLTRSEEGMSLFESDGSVSHIPTAAHVVLDVSGAGDTVISTLTMALVAGASVREACVLANCAGGVVVGAVGIVPILPDQLLQAALRSAGGDHR
ncbi:MAG: D-glycero-beta-D-manno-heptose-7-phosphate kinase [Bacteroidota bacterium]